MILETRVLEILLEEYQIELRARAADISAVRAWAEESVTPGHHPELVRAAQRVLALLEVDA